MKRYLFVVVSLISIFCLAKVSEARNADGQGNEITSLPTAVLISSTGFGPVTSSATATSGLFNYITSLYIVAYASGTTLVTATPYSCTTTNFGGNPAFYFPTVNTAGLQTTLAIQFANPIRSTTVGLGTTVVCPTSAGIQWNVQLGYYQGK